MTVTHNLPPAGSPGAQLIGQDEGVSASSASDTNSGGNSGTAQSIYVASGSAQQSFKNRAGTIGRA